MHTLMGRVVGLLVVLAGASLVRAETTRAPARVNDAACSVVAPDWDKAFTQKTGWTGADAVYSVDLGERRTLWLFGDTWIGSVAKGKHVPGSRLVNNSIAVHFAAPGGVGRAPSPRDVRFYWGPKDNRGQPTAWLVPDPNRIGLQSGQRDDRRTLGWYWLLDGVVLPAGSDDRVRLVLFLARIGRRPGDHGVWGFKGLGGAVAVVDNVHDPVEKWRVEQHENPHAIGADAAAANPNVRQISWGAAVFYDQADPPYLYVYGVKETAPLNKQLLLARVGPASVCRFEAWRFRTADGGWSPDLTRAAPVTEHIVNELSVDRVDVAGRPSLVMVHSEPVFGTRIMLRTARQPWGPWSKPVPVYDVPGVKRNKHYFTYAAKGHAHLSKPGTLLVSYVINSHDFGAMVNDAAIYRPRFIRVRLGKWLFSE
jgi:hypothetical protein